MSIAIQVNPAVKWPQSETSLALVPPSSRRAQRAISHLQLASVPVGHATVRSLSVRLGADLVVPGGLSSPERDRCVCSSNYYAEAVTNGAVSGVIRCLECEHLFLEQPVVLIVAYYRPSRSGLSLFRHVVREHADYAR